MFYETWKLQLLPQQMKGIESHAQINSVISQWGST